MIVSLVSHVLLPVYLEQSLSRSFSNKITGNNTLHFLLLFVYILYIGRPETRLEGSAMEFDPDLINELLFIDMRSLWVWGRSHTNGSSIL